MEMTTELAKRVGYLADEFFGSEHNMKQVTGISRTTIRRIRGGQLRDPRWSVLQKIALTTGADEGWVLNGEGKGPDMSRACQNCEHCGAPHNWRERYAGRRRPRPAPLAALDA
jgi:hypothetical protein